MASFSRYIGIDYSGAETPTASLKGLRVYIADRESPPVEVMPSPSPRKYWTRRGIAGAAGGKHPGAGRHRSRVLVSIVLFRGVSLTGQPSSTISSSTGRPTTIIPTWIWSVFGNGAARMGNARWRRLTEERAGGAKSVFHFDVQGSVAKSTHSGIPWLRFLRKRLPGRVHFWPFDGWDIPPGPPIALPRGCAPRIRAALLRNT
jgi:hypothetical protein